MAGVTPAALAGLSERFTAGIDAFSRKNLASVEQIEAALEAAFGVSGPAVTVSMPTSSDVRVALNLAAPTDSVAVPLNVHVSDYSTGVPALDDVASIRTSDAPLAIDAGGTANLVFGIDLLPGGSTRGYLHDASSLQVELELAAANFASSVFVNSQHVPVSLSEVKLVSGVSDPVVDSSSADQRRGRQIHGRPVLGSERGGSGDRIRFRAVGVS